MTAGDMRDGATIPEAWWEDLPRAPGTYLVRWRPGLDGMGRRHWMDRSVSGLVGLIEVTMKPRGRRLYARWICGCGKGGTPRWRDEWQEARLDVRRPT